MQYFESDVPSGNGRCSDNKCPCPEVVIPRGTGYLYIDQSLVDLRRKFPTMKAVEQAAERWHQQVSAAYAQRGGAFRAAYRPGPILVCEQGAKLRKLDLEVAAADAKHWWETGKVPLRVTPLAGSKAVHPDPPDKAKLLAKLKVLVAVAMADGTVDPHERALLQSLCAKLGLSTDDLEQLFAERMAVDRKDLPESKNEKRELLTDVFKMAAADGRVDDAERRMIGKIAAALGLSRDDVKACAESAKPQKPAPRQSEENVDNRIDRLWESAKRLGWSDADREKAVLIYTELLGLVETSSKYNACASLRNRAISYRSLKRYDEALDDLAKELQLAQRTGDTVRVAECRKVTQQTREWKRKAEVEASGGEKAQTFRIMEETASKLSRAGSDADAVFQSLFAHLQDDDADVRAEASRLLAEYPNALKRLIAVYQECLAADPLRASLAGRVLGRKIAKGGDDMIPAQTAQILYGIPVSFLPCVCDYCGHSNRGIPAPPNGPMTAYYSQKDNQGAYAVPVLCDKCGKGFFVVWDTDPR